jgi:hypothetical protein
MFLFGIDCILFSICRRAACNKSPVDVPSLSATQIIEWMFSLTHSGVVSAKHINFTHNRGRHLAATSVHIQRGSAIYLMGKL